MIRFETCPYYGDRGRRLLVSLLILLGATPLWGLSLAAEATPETLYTTALVRERNLREPGNQPSLSELRTAIAGYEEIVSRFPRSAFDDHSLWQAAGLAIEAYKRYRQQQDLETGVRLLGLLSVSHPASSFAGRVQDRLHQLDTLADVAKLTGITREPLPDAVRVTITLDREVLFHSGYLSNPSRWFFDLPRTQAAPELHNSTLAFTDDGDVVRAVRLGRHPNQITRVVLDAENTENCHAFTLYDPFRLVVDCRRTALASDPAPTAEPDLLPITEPPLVDLPQPIDNVAPSVAPPTTVLAPVRSHPPIRTRTFPASGSPTAAEPSRRITEPELVDLLQPIGEVFTPVASPATAVVPTLTLTEDILSVKALDPILSTGSAPSSNTDGNYSVARQLGLGISRVVIDAGHGGNDPGAAGPGGNEADLVLDLALRLEQRFHSSQPELDVVLTRRTDEYQTLEARTTMANRVGADLFLSIHANASEDTSTRGIETYYLDLAVDPKAEALAGRENVGGLGTMNHLDDLLRTIALNSKRDESRKFAQMVQQTMLRTLRSVDPEIPDLGVKQAPFMVLIGAKMPSILAEVSFLTNNEDATMLSTGTYRDLIVDALFAAIQQYQRSLGPIPILALASPDDF